MIPLFVLTVVTVGVRLAGHAGLVQVDSWPRALCFGLAAMLLLTASAHFGARRGDLIAMVPPPLPRPGMLVTVTGLLEAGIAVGLLFAGAAPAAGAALAVLLIAMFPANVHAAREGVSVGGRPPMPTVPRALLQCLFIAAAVTVAATG